MWRSIAPRNTGILVKSAGLNPAVRAIFAPLAAMAFALGLWALAAQAALAANFPIEHGALADWRAWFLIAAGLEFTARRR